MTTDGRIVRAVMLSGGAAREGELPLTVTPNFALEAGMEGGMVHA
jgi:hypothetical protein